MVEMNKEEEKEGMTIIKGKEAIGLRIVNMFVAMALWLGAIHFNVALIVLTVCFLPISKAILLVLFPSSPFLFCCEVICIIWVFIVFHLLLNILFSGYLGCLCCL